MRWSPSQSVYATLGYAEIFFYPLTAEEIHQYLIAPFTQSVVSVNKRVINRYKIGDSQYYSLKKNPHLVKRRQKRESESIKKWQLLKQVLPWLTWIPTVEFIGVSGSLAMNNADDDDDIDLFIICKDHSIWITRLLLLVVLEIAGKRRRFGQQYQKDLFCPNMFIVSSYLAVPEGQRDIYSAHEIVQLKPVFSVNNTYEKFLDANRWVLQFMPHGYKGLLNQAKEQPGRRNVYMRSIAANALMLLNQAVKVPQIWMINRHRTREVVTDTVLRFHPQDARIPVRKKFISLLQQKNIPLDSRFF